MAALLVGRTDIVEKEAKNSPKEGGGGDSLVGREGIEPSANGLKGHCSTTELPTREWQAKNALEL